MRTKTKNTTQLRCSDRLQLPSTQVVQFLEDVLFKSKISRSLENDNPCKRLLQIVQFLDVNTVNTVRYGTIWTNIVDSFPIAWKHR